MRRDRARYALYLLPLFLSVAPLRAEESPAIDDPPPAAAPDEEPKPTDLGVRLTPRMSRAIGQQFAKQMKGRYDLDEKQVARVTDIIAKRMLTLGQAHGEMGRDAIEQMTAAMIENDGRFDEKSGQEFARLMKPLIPIIKSATKDTTGEISRVMTVKQRLEFTRDVAAFSAGVVVFEERMKKWEGGELTPGANPFFEYSYEDPGATSRPSDETESAEYRAARTQAERYVRWQANRETGWDQYLQQAAQYYGFDSAQNKSGRAILADCRSRAKKIRTTEWVARVREAVLRQNLSWSLDAPYSDGPWSWKAQVAVEEVIRPMTDVENEMKRRIDELATTAQRDAADERAKALLEQKRRKPTAAK